MYAFANRAKGAASAKAYSLHKHLRDAWSVFNPEIGEYVTAVPPASVDARRFDSGVADRILESWHILRRSGAKRVLLLDASHVYRMDYAALVESHCRRALDLTIAYVESDGRGAATRALMEITNDEPGAPRVSALWASVHASQPGSAVRAMGIYVIELDLLRAALEEDARDDGSGHDFELDVLAPLVERLRVGAYRFGGNEGRVTRDRFWSGLGSVDEYFAANLALLEPVPPLDLYQQAWPIRSRAERNPPARTVASREGDEGIFVNSIVSNGSVIAGAAVSQSVLSPRVRVEDSATVERSVLFHDVVVGPGAELRNCIVEKGARIAPGDRIGFDRARNEERFHVTPGGVVVVPKRHPHSREAFGPPASRLAETA